MSRQLSCCGYHELEGMNMADPPAMFSAIKDIVMRDPYDYRSGGGFIMTRTARTALTRNSIRKRRKTDRYYRELGRFLEVKKLGTLTRLPIFINPNSGNYIQTAIVTLDGGRSRMAVRNRWLGVNYDPKA